MHFLITAGGTREYIDPVRFISNASSGRMGYVLAEAALKAGHKATLISASDTQPPVGVYFVGVETAAEMFTAVKKFFKSCDCLIMSAAVSDYTPVKKSKIKIKKSKRDLVIRLKPTVDILSWAGKNKRKDQFVVGFALEDKDLRKQAEKKLKEKNPDMIIANKLEAIGADKSAVFFKSANTNSRWQKVEYAAKATIAKKIIQVIERLSC